MILRFGGLIELFNGSDILTWHLVNDINYLIHMNIVDKFLNIIIKPVQAIYIAPTPTPTYPKLVSIIRDYLPQLALLFTPLVLLVGLLIIIRNRFRKNASTQKRSKARKI